MSYAWIKALHIISIISWMAGMLYLPRLFVYHASAKPGSELSETLKVMERKLLRFIMTPAMIASFVFGIWMIALNPEIMHHPYMHVKLTAVLALAGVHGYFSGLRKAFAADRNAHSGRFYRILNEAPTLLMILIVIMVVVQPGP